MANHKGSEGSVKSGSNAVAEVRSWSLETQAETIEDSIMGDTWKTKKPGMMSWSGQVACWWDETDTNGQQTMQEGDEITLNLYPEGSASTDVYYTGSAIITGVQYQAAHDGMVEATISFEGNGALTQSTVA